MAATAKKEKHEEEVAFATFSTWCTAESSSLQGAIATGAQAIEGLSAEIGKLQSEVIGLGESIAKLSTDVSGFEADKKAATEQRAKDNAAFVAESQDYSESIDALERAIAVLLKESYDRPAAAAALVQLSDRPSMPNKARSILAAFVGMDSTEDSDSEAPEANAYEFQSTGVVDLLKKLKDEFRSKLGDSQKN
jgi:outer membrane murein-binding lipoprotein Lpp/acyl carrier protein